MNEIFDVAIIGGGINGCGIAADASMRGLSVILIEKDDLASKTSSSSTKLIHGGLRYLEHFNFSLVKKSLHERQLLLNLAPHLVYSLPFILPLQPSIRSSWFLRTGLFFYDNLSRINLLPKSRLVKRTQNSAYFLPLMEQFTRAFLFYDGITDDARLTLANALQAKEHGALILTRTELLNSNIVDTLWHLNISLKQKQGTQYTVKARTVINASGPWVEIINQRLMILNHYKLSLSKGSHLIVPKLYEGNHAYLLQNDDRRVVFVIPYHGYSMIGTTDVKFLANPDDASISSAEIDYLLQLIKQYFKCQLWHEDIITTWSGVRPLLATAAVKSLQTLNRDYAYHFTMMPAPAISIYGGKITTYRQLAADVVNELRIIFPSLPASNTDKTLLPGACLGKTSYADYIHYAHKNYYFLDKTLLTRWLTTYGTKIETLLAGCHGIFDLGYHFGHGLFQREVDYLLKEEWACQADDILWRRTKLGLCATPQNKAQLTDYCAKQFIR